MKYLILCLLLIGCSTERKNEENAKLIKIATDYCSCNGGVKTFDTEWNLYHRELNVLCSDGSRGYYIDLNTKVITKCEQPKLSCEEQIEEDAKSCKDINCKLEYIVKLRKCYE